MLKYLLGFLKNLFNPSVSLFALIDLHSHVSRKARIHLGAKVFESTVGRFSYLTRGSSLIFSEIGKFCSIGHGAIVGLANHTTDKLSVSPLFTEKKNATGHSWAHESIVHPYEKVFLGNDVWVGSRAMILGGVNIGDGAVIGAGAIVTKDVPPYAVVAGIPAKVIRFRFDEETVKDLLEIKWWDFPDTVLKNSIEIFQGNLNILELKNLKKDFIK